MDVVFDIDGTLADASHRLHFIKDPKFWISGKTGFGVPNWDAFLSDDLVAKDEPIRQIWRILNLLHLDDARILFITGRKESSRSMTVYWLLESASSYAFNYWFATGCEFDLYMRSENDRRPSHQTKRDALHRARADGYNPTLVFEDRADDAKMWREEGLLCCQVAEGNY